MKRILLVLPFLPFCFTPGCESRSAPLASRTSAPPTGSADTVKKAAAHPPAGQDTGEVGYWERVTTLYEKAKASGETSAANAREWIGELYDSTRSSGETAANASSEWIQKLYEQAKQAGETSASSAKEWVMDDIQQIGSWRYMTLEVRPGEDTDTVARLNELGVDRWECFWVDRRGDATTFYLKKAGRSYLRHLPSRELIRLLPLLGGDESPPE